MTTRVGGFFLGVACRRIGLFLFARTGRFIHHSLPLWGYIPLFNAKIAVNKVVHSVNNRKLCGDYGSSDREMEALYFFEPPHERSVGAIKKVGSARSSSP